MPAFDIAPFALPNAPAGEYWFEETRDIREVVVRFRTPVPRRAALEYWQNRWPATRVEDRADREDPARFGWTASDDWFNGRWQRARITREVRQKTLRVRFRGLRSEKLPDAPAAYDVDFRRTMGIRLGVSDWSAVRKVEIYTCSEPVETALTVELDAGRRTRGRHLQVTGYNACLAGDDPLGVPLGKKHRFPLTVRHLRPVHSYAGDDGLIEFHLDHDVFTVSLEALRRQGPVWYAEEGVFVARSDEPVTFEQYRRQHATAKTVSQRIADLPEHSYARAFHGQPRPHAVAYSLGCRHSPQRFWLEPNGDLVLHRRNVLWLGKPGVCGQRFLNRGNARFFFGLEDWVPAGRFTDPSPVPVYNLRLHRDDLQLHQRTLCVPLMAPIQAGDLKHDDVTVALMRFRLTNAGTKTVDVQLPIGYSDDSGRQSQTLGYRADQTDHLVPRSPLVPLQVDGDALLSQHEGTPVLRALVRGDVTVSLQSGPPSVLESPDRGSAAANRLKPHSPEAELPDAVGPVRAGDPACFTWPLSALVEAHLEPGRTCEFVVKVPYVALRSDDELRALRALDFDVCQSQLTAFWRHNSARGAQLRTPVPQLDTLHANHWVHTQITDFVMPGDPALINTSVGSSTYGNFSNESCMIVQELDQRGMALDAQRRLDLWIRYQGTKPQPGNFADCDGMFYGAGGFESGSYNQHHGWVLWALAEHFLITGNREWFAGIVHALLTGAEWVFRQRELGKAATLRSRGWERGFLPAGSLEDVTEFHYWLSTNCLTWRGVDAAARALEAFNHPEAGRVRTKADAYRRDLLAGFETMRQHAPLVRLRDGRWVPHYPSRLYCRGRDQGWIREVLEGAVYLLISGILDTGSREAAWILDDFQDNLYHNPPYGYVLRDQATTLEARGGFSIQPCLLAGLLPHLDRDEPDIFLWMLFNAIAAVYRDEISGMIEHPMPELGFSNSVTFKTSDEANAVMWLRYAYVYWTPGLLHFGRALPRAWFAQEHELALTGMRTHHGTVSIRYLPDPGARKIRADVDLGGLRACPDAIRVRFRTPDSTPLRAVHVNGEAVLASGSEDVDLTGRTGAVRVQVQY